MNIPEINKAMEYVDDELVSGAEAYAGKPQKTVWLRRAAAAACICLVLAGAVGVNGFIKNRQTKDLTGKYAITPITKKNSDNTDTGVYIQPLELPKNSSASRYSMIGLVVYKGGIYTQAESYFGNEAKQIDKLVGKHLGYATGSIDEWSSKDEYSEEFASSMAGNVYEVIGYDTDFRICIRKELENENGEKQPVIYFLERLNGITLQTGADLFETRLKISGRISSVQWQSHDDWDYDKGNIQNAVIDDTLLKEFLKQIDNGSFVYTWKADAKEKTVYDTQNRAHIFLTMEDGTVIRLQLFEGGYVGYDALGWYFVQIPSEVFDSVFNACTGGK